MVFFSLFHHIFRNRLNTHILTKVVVVDVSLHGHQVDNTTEGLFCTDRQLDRHCICVQSFLQHTNAAVEVRTVDVHLVDINHTRNLVLVSLSPNGFRLGFNTTLCAKNGDSTVKDTQGTFYFDSKVDVTGGVNDVDTMNVLLEIRGIMVLGVSPVASGSGRRNGDTAFLFLNHPVHRSGTFMGFADLVSLTRVEKNSFGGSGLTGVNVRHNTNVSGSLKRIFSRHG